MNINIKSIQEKIKSFLKEVYVELKRVSWLPRDQIIRYTIIIVVATFIVAMFLGGLDYIFSSAIKMFIFK